MTNAEIIAAMPKLADYEAENEALSAQIETLVERQRVTQAALDTLRQVNLVVNGVALRVLGDGTTSKRYWAIADDSGGRWSECYLNAHNDRTYGVRVCAASDVIDTFCGKDFGKKDAESLCVEFVTGTASGPAFRAAIHERV